MPERISWDTSIEGQSPLLIADPSNDNSTIVIDEAEIHAERIRRANEQASELSHSRFQPAGTAFLRGAQNREIAHGECLEQLGNVNLNFAADRQTLIAHHLREYSRALYQQGRFNEALLVAVDDEERDYINRLIEADAKPDDDECACEREVVDGLTLCRRFERESILSPRLGKVVTVKECSRCGDLNIFEGLPKRQQRIALLRAKAPLADDSQLLRQV